MMACVAGYLESFEESRTQEQEKTTQSQENVVSLLEHCSRVRRGFQYISEEQKTVKQIEREGERMAVKMRRGRWTAGMSQKNVW